jgi:hypothetical protein
MENLENWAEGLFARCSLFEPPKSSVFLQKTKAKKKPGLRKNASKPGENTLSLIFIVLR